MLQSILLKLAAEDGQSTYTWYLVNKRQYAISLELSSPHAVDIYLYCNPMSVVQVNGILLNNLINTVLPDNYARTSIYVLQMSYWKKDGKQYRKNT